MNNRQKLKKLKYKVVRMLPGDILVLDSDALRKQGATELDIHDIMYNISKCLPEGCHVMAGPVSNWKVVNSDELKRVLEDIKNI